MRGVCVPQITHSHTLFPSKVQRKFFINDWFFDGQQCFLSAVYGFRQILDGFSVSGQILGGFSVFSFEFNEHLYFIIFRIYPFFNLRF